MDPARFDFNDLGDAPPTPGDYAGTVVTARLCRSSRGHRMVAVTVALDGVAAGRDRVSDYFVLEGATARGRAVARWRLVALYRACGLSPRDGDEIRPDALVGARLVVTLEHEQRADRLWARVAAYRALAAAAHDDDVPF
jgi:hypothetical protein